MIDAVQRGELTARARALAAQLEPLAALADASSTIDEGVRELLAASGLGTVVLPSAYGGPASAWTLSRCAWCARR